MSLPKLQPAAPAATIANRKIAEAILLIFILFLPKITCVISCHCKALDRYNFFTTRFSYSFGVYPVIFLNTELK